MAPGQVLGREDNGQTYKPKGLALCFHPDLIKGSSLAARMREYTFFAYEANEALHLSDREREIIIECLHHIRHEMDHGLDRLSKRLITTNIELMLDYCLRFYERQFITRETVNVDILSRFERLIDTYFSQGKAVEGLPTVKWCASELCLSPNYFGDLIKKETGRTALEHIQLRIMSMAKERLMDPTRSISQISYELGYQYPQHFTRMFKKIVGLTPNEYRSGNTN